MICKTPHCSQRTVPKHSFCGYHLGLHLRGLRQKSNPPAPLPAKTHEYCFVCGSTRKVDAFVVGATQRVCWKCYFQYFERQVRDFLEQHPSLIRVLIYDAGDGSFCLISGDAAFWGLMRCGSPLHPRVRETLEALDFYVVLGALPEVEVVDD